MVGGHRRVSPARGSSPEDSSGEDGPRAVSAPVGRAPRNPRRRVPACAQLSQPSVRPPPREATGGSNSGAHPEQSPVPSLAGDGPPRRQHPRRQAAPSAPSPERGAEARRRLEFGDATPAQALQAAQLLLRHPPSPAQDGPPAAPWLQDVLALIDTAQRQAAQGASLAPSRETPSASRVRNSVVRPHQPPPRRERGEAGGSGPRQQPEDPTLQTEASRPRRRRRRQGQEENSPSRRQRSEDLRTSLERQRELRRGAEPFEDQASSGSALRGPRRGSPVGRRPGADAALGPRRHGAGCHAFTDDLRRVRWPEKFRPAPIEKYDGSASPDEFIQIYTTVVEAAGGTPKVMANYFPTALSGSARSWLMNLPAASIDSWDDLCDQFVANFQGTSTRPGEEDDLYQVRQHKGESLRKYIQRFCQCRNTIAKISGESVCIAFRRGVRDSKMAEKLATRVISSPTELFALADKCARAAEARERQSGRLDAKEPKPSDPQEGPSSGGKKKKRKGTAELVAAVEFAQARTRRDARPVNKREAGRADVFCPIHISRSHDLRDCRVVEAITEKRGHGARAPD